MANSKTEIENIVVGFLKNFGLIEKKEDCGFGHELSLIESLSVLSTKEIGRGARYHAFQNALGELINKSRLISEHTISFLEAMIRDCHDDVGGFLEHFYRHKSSLHNLGSNEINMIYLIYKFPQYTLDEIKSRQLTELSLKNINLIVRVLNKYPSLSPAFKKLSGFSSVSSETLEFLVILGNLGIEEYRVVDFCYFIFSPKEKAIFEEETVFIKQLRDFFFEKKIFGINEVCLPYEISELFNYPIALVKKILTASYKIQKTKDADLFQFSHLGNMPISLIDFLASSDSKIDYDLLAYLDRYVQMKLSHF